MTLDDIREIKERFLRPRARAEALGAWEDLVKTASPRAAAEAKRVRAAIDLRFPSVAVGATRQDGQLRVAIRVSEKSRGASRLVECVARAAHGEVSVVNVGRIRPLPAARPRAVAYRDRVRPLRAGYSVGHRDSTGTLGAFVVDRDDEVCILSNNHVLASTNVGSPGDAVLQPGVADGGGRGRDHVGWLKRHVPLSTLSPNKVDAAIAVLRADVDHVPALHGERALSGARRGAMLPGTRVWKVGRTSGLTAGAVSAFALDNLRVDYGTMQLEFDDQLEVVGDAGAFSGPGDSGSLVLDERDRAAGLLFAGSESGGPRGTGVTYVNPISAVLSALRVTLQMATPEPTH